MNLLKLLSFLVQLIDGIKAAIKRKEINDLVEAKDKALEEKDQRKLEEALGGSSGPVSPDKYPGLSTRPHEIKKK